MSLYGSKQMVDKGKIFLTVESQIIKVDKILDLKDHDMSTITIIDSGKNYQWVLKLVGESLRSNRILA